MAKVSMAATMSSVWENGSESLVELCQNGVYYLNKAPTGIYYYNYMANIVLSAIATAVGCVANLLVIIAYFKTFRRHEFNTTLLAYLATADLLITVLVQPLMISRLTLELFDQHYCLYWLVIRRLFEFSVPVSFLSVGLITYERYQALFCPVKYRTSSLRRRIKITMIIIWLFALVTTCLRFFHFFVVIYYFMALFIIIALVAANTVIYVKIGKMASVYTKDRRATAQKMCDTRSSRKILAKDKRSTRTLFYIFLSLVICYLPMLGAILYSVINGQSHSMQFLFGYLPWADAFAFLNSTLDPFIYCLRNPKLKNAVLAFVCRRGYRKRDSCNEVGARNSLMLQNSSSDKKCPNDSRNS
ncbi:beta-2 adrenergic receptor-like [Paramuricea clavata]|uniref:Beta-2 adrenergic receptor-like n=1 Tax=Paramuricea clavata TaxID=317549 RepID=A0A6S7G6F9_PARCT|nr:beta-2 adrenergic receptor-like [Paramuricea clavata]